MAIGFFRRLFGKRDKDDAPEDTHEDTDNRADEDTDHADEPSAASSDHAPHERDHDGRDHGERDHDAGQARAAAASAELPAAERRYCSVGLEACDLGDGEEVLRPRQPRPVSASASASASTGAGAAVGAGGPAPLRVPLHDGDLLRRCDRFLTLDEHARALCDTLDGGDAMHEEVVATLHGFVRAGLMHRRDRLLAGLRAQAAQAPLPPPITRLMIGTCDRVDLVTRAVQTHAASLGAGPAAGDSSDDDASARPVEVVILDHAADDSARHTLQHALVPLARTAGHRLSIRYAGPAQRRQLADALAEHAGHELRESIELALHGMPESPFHAGASRNAALLLGAGSMLVWADDDTRCPLARMPGSTSRGQRARRDLRLSPRLDPTDLVLHADAAQALAAADVDVDREAQEAQDGRDLLAVHQTLLGKSVGQCLGLRADAAVDLDRLPLEVIDQLAAGRGQVLVTATGLAGDLGVDLGGGPSPGGIHALLRLDDEARARLLADRDTYERLRSTHHGLRGVDRPTLSPSGTLLTRCMGLDHRTLLPPFFPVDRGHEHVFAALLRACRDDAYVGHLPWLVQHLPGARPERDREALFAPAAGPTTAMHALLAVNAHGLAPALHDPAQRMAAMGRHLQMLGSLRPAEYRDFIREHHLEHAGASIAALHEARMRYQEHGVEGSAGQPDAVAAWLDDLAEGIERWRDLVTSPDWGAPRDLQAAVLTPGEAWAAAQGAIRRFGQLVEAWPRIVSAARALAESGPSMTVPLHEAAP